MDLNFSGSPPLSGCSCKALFLYAFPHSLSRFTLIPHGKARISVSGAVGSTPSISLDLSLQASCGAEWHKAPPHHADLPCCSWPGCYLLLFILGSNAGAYGMRLRANDPFYEHFKA